VAPDAIAFTAAFNCATVTASLAAVPGATFMMRRFTLALPTETVLILLATEPCPMATLCRPMATLPVPLARLRSP
jgi:hypothetical protein